MNRFSRRLSTGASSVALIAATVLLVPGAALAQAAPAHSTTAAARPGVPGWKIASPDIVADSSVRFGTLPNGMRYALRVNSIPKGGASIRFGFRVAKLHEDPKALGVAHYLEHMAFNGSKNIPEGQLVPMLERLGLAFGADTNAETGFIHTLYKLDLPKTDAATVDAGMLMMRELAGNLLIDKAAVERERGIIQSEARVRNDATRRLAARQFSALMPGTSIGEGLSITPEIVAGTTAADIRAYYDAYYRPENATMVIVGDFDVDAMERKVRAQFADWQGRGTARPVALPTFAPTGTNVGTFSDPALPENIELQRISAFTPPSNSVAERRDELMSTVVSLAMQMRLAKIALDPASPILSANVFGRDLFQTSRVFGISLSAKDGRWKDALALGEAEMRRAQNYGFSASEIDEAKTRLQSIFTNRAIQSASATSAARATNLFMESLENQVPTSDATDLELYNRLAPSFTKDAIDARFRSEWAGGPNGVFVATKAPIDGGVETVKLALAEAAKVAVAAPVEQQAVAFAYDDFGPAGKVVFTRLDAASGVRQIRFANNVELNIKRTDFEPGRILVSTHVGTGLRSFPADRPGLSFLVTPVSGSGGLEKHDATELNRVTAGKQVGYGLSGGNRAITLQGSTNAADLEFQLKLMAAQILAPGYRPEAQAQWSASAPIAAKTMQGDAMQVLSMAFTAAMASDDARIGLRDPSQLTRRSVAELKAALDPQLQKGPIAVGIVGDVDEAAAIAAVAKTLGALPTRASSKAPIKVAPLRFPTDRTVQTVTHGGAANQGGLALSWKTTDDSDYRSVLTRDLLGAVFQLRLTSELREKMGATYSPQAGSVASDAYPGFGGLFAALSVEPSKMAAVRQAIVQVTNDLRAAPVEADELLRARKALLESADRQQRQNGSWLGPVTAAQSRPDRLVRFKTRKAGLEALTPADVHAEAKKWFAAPPLEVRSVPASTAK